MTDLTDIVERLTNAAAMSAFDGNDGRVSLLHDGIQAITRLRAETEALRKALRTVRDILETENEDPFGPICDTIWMPGGTETLFDFIGAAIAATKGAT